MHVGISRGICPLSGLIFLKDVTGMNILKNYKFIKDLGIVEHRNTVLKRYTLNQTVSLDLLDPGSRRRTFMLR